MNVKIKTSSEHGFIISSVWHLSIITLYLTHGNYKDVLNVLEFMGWKCVEFFIQSG